jgi:hypothetical protein
MAVREHRTRTCVLNPEEADRFRSRGELSSCREHTHLSRTKAIQLTTSLLFAERGKRYYEAYWVGPGKRAIMFHDARGWRKAPSGSYSVMQFVPGGGYR